MYVDGTMHPAWWKFFAALHQFASAAGESTGIDDTDPPDQPFDVVSDNAAYMATLLSIFASRNYELEKIIEESTFASPRIGYVPLNVMGDTMHGTLTVFASSVDRPAMRFKDGILQTSPQPGDVEYSDGHWYVTNGARHSLTTAAGVKTETTTVENTAVETTIYSYEFQPEEIHADHKITLILSGVYTNDSASDDFDIRIKIGGATIHTIERVGGNKSNAFWELTYSLTIRTDGASGAYVDAVKWHDSTDFYSYTEATEHSIDTTAARELLITMQWDNAKAGNVLKCTQGALSFEH